jgi:hypothetical protein
MTEHLHHKLSVLQQNLLHGKLPRALAWEDAVSLVSHMGRVESHAGDEVTFVIGAERASFKQPQSGELDIDDVSRLRKLLKSSVVAIVPTEHPQPCRMIVVVDHHSAHVYRDIDGSRPKEVNSIQPLDPHHFHHHLVHKKEAHYQGDRVPEDTVYFNDIATALAPANEIVLIGHGVGKSNAATALNEYLQAHVPQLAKLVKSVKTADLSALTEPEIELIAKRHMISVV